MRARVAAALDRAIEQSEHLLALVDDEERFEWSAPCSSWSRGAHLAHLARTGGVTLDRLDAILDDESAGDPASRTWVGRLILLFGRIPRGRGRAPRETRPPEVPVREEVRRDLETLDERLRTLRGRLDEVLAVRTGVRHPYFGVLTPSDWVRFLAIHQDHHLRIVDDIGRRRE